MKQKFKKNMKIDFKFICIKFNYRDLYYKNFIATQKIYKLKTFPPPNPSMHQPEYDSQSSQESQTDLNKGQFRQQTLQQYYRYLNLLKRTNNFCKDLQVYKNLSDHDFEDLAIVGWIFQIENNYKIKLENGDQQLCLRPVVYSNIKDPFKNYLEPNSHKNIVNQQASSQTSESSKRAQTQKPLSSSVCGTSEQGPKTQVSLQPHINRPLFVLKSTYIKHFFKAFNQVLKESKQFKKFFVQQTPSNNTTNTHNAQNVNIFNEIEWIYAFTGLRLAVQSGKLFFMITQKTKVVALDTKFYTQAVQNLQKSVGFPYSYLNLNVMPKHYDAETIEQGYSLSALQTQASVIEKLAFTGILKQKVVEMVVNSTKKDKQLILTFSEDSLFPGKEMLGQAKLIIKYSVEESQEFLLSFFKVGFIYLVTNACLEITDNINIILKLKQKWQDNVFSINIQKSPEISHNIIRQLPVVQMSWLKLANVNRNVFKMKVDLVRCEHFFGKLVCTICKAPVNSQGYCTRFCGQNQGQLILWVIALVSDESTFAQLSMEKNETIQFFNFTPEHIQQIRKYILAQNSRKMVRLFDKFLHSTNSNSTEPIMSFQLLVSMKFISKELIGVARYNLNQSFAQHLSEQEKIEFQQSLQSSKEYMKKNKVHFNGYVKKIQKNLRKVVPYIKVLQVL